MSLNTMQFSRAFALWALASMVLSGCVSVRSDSPVDISTSDILAFPVRDANTMRIHFVNVGQGMCHIVECPTTPPTLPTAFMYDCGSSADAGQFANAVKYISTVLAPVSNVPVFLSHKDKDHTNWFINQAGGLDQNKFGAVRASEKKEVYALDVQKFFDAHKPREWFKYNYPTENEPVVTNIPVSNFDCGDADVAIVAVNAASGGNANDDSLVLAIQYAKYTALLTGDAQIKTQTAALETLQSRSMLPVNLVTASHHGANTHSSNNDAWVFGIAPSAVVFSAYIESYKHPRCDVVERYNNMSTLLTMKAAMDIECGENQKSKSKVNTAKALFTTQENGTIAVDVSADGKVKFHCEKESSHCVGP